MNPATGKSLGSVALGTSKDVDIAVAAAKKAYKTSWGHKVTAEKRGIMLYKLAELIEKHAEEFAVLESLDVGKPLWFAKIDVGTVVTCIRYYAGWADKISGKTIETDETKMCYTRHEPFGVVGQIIPWNFPIGMLSWKVGPALATGNAIVLKPSELTPLTALKFASLVNEAGFPPGVVNIVNGYGYDVGQAIAEHKDIRKVAFTGSTLTGRKIQEAAARTNLKVVSLELGGKSPNIIFDDADIEQAVKWAARGVFLNNGEACTAGSRIFVQEGVYDKFVQAFSQVAAGLGSLTGDPFGATTQHGPLISQTQFDRVMGYINSGKAQGATLKVGGDKHGTEGFYITPTIFTDCHKDMKIVREEIFGPVAVILKFKTEEEVIELANDTVYGLGCGVFTGDMGRAIRVSNALEAGISWINCYNSFPLNVPFGGMKQSGYGRELGEYALELYTQVKAVHINVSEKI